jgi:hypothetical protein
MLRVSLPSLPAGFADTREALHRLAEQVIKPAREQTSGEWTLTETPGGFGTPVFGDDCQVRVEGDELIVRERGEERRTPIETLAGAAEAIGPGLLPHGLAGLDEDPLGIDPAASAALAAAYALGREALDLIRGAAGPGDEPTEPTLWPEHFDLAIEIGSEPPGRRANYGLSPGDADHPEPYFYVGPWAAVDPGPVWNARGFGGAELGYRELAAAEDPVALSVEFALERKQAIDRQERP